MYLYYDLYVSPLSIFILKTLCIWAFVPKVVSSNPGTVKEAGVGHFLKKALCALLRHYNDFLPSHLVFKLHSGKYFCQLSKIQKEACYCLSYLNGSTFENRSAEKQLHLTQN